MLKTPTYGQYVKEERTLVFGPPRIYMGFVFLTVAGGAAMLAYGQLSGTGMTRWWTLTGLAVLLAGILAFFSIVRMSVNLRKGTYIRYDGLAFIPKVTRGSVADFDAVVVIRAPESTGLSTMILIHWKGGAIRPLIAESESMLVNPQLMIQRAIKYGASLGVPVYDNTHFVSKHPLAPF